MYFKNLPFKYCGSVAVLCDLWTPEEPLPGGSPLVIFYHGGGWRIGDKNWWDVARRWRDRLLEAGVAFASAGYRHSAYGGRLSEVASDGADAVRFFAKNGADYGLDPARILLAGHSAGGHVALLVSLVGERFRDAFSDRETPCLPVGAVSIAGTPNLAFASYDKPPLNPEIAVDLPLLVGEGWQDPAVLAEAEPQRYVERGEARHIPVLCLQPEEDAIVPPGMAVDFCRIGAAQGYDFRRLPLYGTGHCLEDPTTKQVSSAALKADEDIYRFVLEVFGMDASGGKD